MSGGADRASSDSRAVLERCEQHGFASAGICSARPSAYAKEYRAWLASGAHGQMAYLAADVDERLDPTRLVPGACSVICVADRYAVGGSDERRAGRGRIARYARGEDYHAVIRGRLEALVVELRRAHPGHRFRVCVDTAPLLEREYAARAGLGRIGKHTLLIGPPGQGSWVALGAVVTTLPLEARHGGASALDAAASPDPCGACTRCIDACPTSAITPWSVNAARCISYVTIEHRGAVDPELGAHVQDWIFGCDICQEVCPHNQPTRRARQTPVHPAYAPHPPYQMGFDLLAVLGWQQADWDAACLHGALRRADRSMWVRNAALAAGCALRGEPTGVPPSPEHAARLRAALKQLSSDASQPPEVRTAAAAALAPGP